MKNTLWYMPAYYPHFACKIDQCRNTCCSLWRIPVSRKEYEALISMECSDELYGRIQRAFEEPEIVSEDCYRYICYNWLGRCPIQDQGYCSLQREKGEAFLPKICRLYPRSLKRLNGINLASCSSSCEAVLEYLFDHDELQMISQEMDAVPEITYDLSEEDSRQIALFQQIIKDRKTTLSQSIKDICTIVNQEQFSQDFNSPDDHFTAMISLLERFISTNERFETIVRPIIERYADDPSLYQEDTLAFETSYPGWMEFFERVINNSMLYEIFPFVDSRMDKTKAYKGLCVCYGMMRFICIGNHHFHKEKDSMIDALSALFHLIDHTAFYYNINIIADNAAIMLRF